MFDLQPNYENLIAQIIIETLADDKNPEPDYLQSEDGKFWLDLISVDERRITNAINFRMDNEQDLVADRRYIMERLD